MKRWDYASPGWYFVTLCAQNRECLFGIIENGKMALNHSGKILEIEWRNLRSRFDYIELDEHAIMPNHFHALIQITGKGESCIRPYSEKIGKKTKIPLPSGDKIYPGDLQDRPYGTETGSFGRIVQAFKSITTHKYIKAMTNLKSEPFQKRLWQRNYFEHIIRNEKELDETRRYIRGNPAAWPLDDENPERRRGDGQVHSAGIASSFGPTIQK